MRRAEAAVATLVTLAAIWLHFVAAKSLGGLWRDEANTVGLATMPTLHDVAKNLQFDSFPILWLVVIRAFSDLVGPMNDPAFRALGFAVGVGVIATLWLNARTFGHSFPFFSVVLLGLAPSVIVWGDSMRAYGFGILLSLLTAALLWRFVEQPSTRRLCFAAVAAVASVQTLFYNSVLLLAFCAGAVAVCAIDRKWRTAGLTVLIGVVSAVSLIPYVPEIRAASSWNMLVRMRNYTLPWFWKKLEETIDPVGSWGLAIWSTLFIVALIAALIAILPRPQREATRRERKTATQQRGKRARRRQREVASAPKPEKPAAVSPQRRVALFALTTLIVGVVGIFLFLHQLSYPTQPWYYLSLLALVALCIDVIFGAVIRSREVRIGRLVVVAAIAVASFSAASGIVGTRLSNIDLIASQLQRSSQKGDVIVVTPWYHGVSFSRYHRGAADWMTLPPLGFHRFHRYDLFKQQMMAADQTAPTRDVIEKARVALQQGRTVFIAGWFDFPPPAQPSPPLPPAPLPDLSWPEELYTTGWTQQFTSFIQAHATTVTQIPVEAPRRVSPYENVSLIAASGWKP